MIARQHRLALLAAAPAVLFLAIFFLFPVARLFSLSFDGASFAPYGELVRDDFYAFVVGETFRIGAIVTLLSVLLGYPLAFALANSGRFWSTVILICVLLPFWTSMLVRTYAWMVLLGRNGIINNLLMWLGLTERPLQLLHNETAVIIGMLHVLMPFFVFPVFAVMRRIDKNLLLAAEGLGASSWAVFKEVYLPLTMPGIVAGVSLVFILAIGFFITPALLGGGRVMMAAILIEQEVRQFLNWDLGAALSVVLLLTTLTVYALINRLGRPAGRRLG